MDVFGLKNRVRRIKAEGTYFQNNRWQLVTILEQLSGVWPYQNKFKQYCTQTIHHLALLGVFLPLINKFMEFIRIDDIAMVAESLLFIVFLLILDIKLILASMFQRTKRQMYEHVVEHFRTITDCEEAKILKECVDSGFRYSITIICIAGAIAASYDSIPILKSFYVYYFVDGTLNTELPIPMDYGFDHGKYWYIIVIGFLGFICSGATVEFSHDLSFILQVYHARALFEIVEWRLNRASELVSESEIRVTSDDHADQVYSLISSAIDLHSEGLDMVELIEETYTINWFVVLMLNTAVLGASVFVLSAKLDDPIELIRYLFAFVVVLLHFQVIFSRGQIIIDSSSSIFDTCCACNWYGLPTKSCKLLTMMMIRASMPCQITGARLFPLSIETFGKMLKGGLSYYTVFET